VAKVWKAKKLAMVLSRQQLGMDCQGPRIALGWYARENLLQAVVDMAVFGIHSRVSRRLLVSTLLTGASCTTFIAFFWPMIFPYLVGMIFCFCLAEVLTPFNKLLSVPLAVLT
jgi:hypothetical protein